MVEGGGWRWWVSAGGAGLVVLPLGQGAPLVAVVAAVYGLIVVGAWVWGSRSGRAVGMSVGVALVAVLASTFAVSQWPGSLIAAPWLDWFMVWWVVGVVCLAALIVDLWVVDQGVGWKLAAGKARWVASVATLATVLLLCGCVLGLIQTDGDGALRFPARDDEVLPLPASLRLVSADTCAEAGNGGACMAKFVVTAGDGAGRAATVTRLVEHLRSRGWPLQPGPDTFSGHRETGGILNWRPHRMWLYTEAEPASVLRPAPPFDVVVIYISDL
ncbi:hypothetical protein GA0070621_1080 [Micromonospora narathiwatensis]|uniref:Uncharacterized protein n=2 Tax=Micromonospora narathiwatensis TaxID=299146 RepID=A0A1A8ZAM3_9ACTN|nr:hypothetical protein GA0070621_1080 [Micromonospora narathiwatensis]